MPDLESLHYLRMKPSTGRFFGAKFLMIMITNQPPFELDNNQMLDPLSQFSDYWRKNLSAKIFKRIKIDHCDKMMPHFC